MGLIRHGMSSTGSKVSYILPVQWVIFETEVDIEVMRVSSLQTGVSILERRVTHSLATAGPPPLDAQQVPTQWLAMCPGDLQHFNHTNTEIHRASSSFCHHVDYSLLNVSCRA